MVDEITVKSKLDNSEFDRKAREMKKKLEEIRSLSSMAFGDEKNKSFFKKMEAEEASKLSKILEQNKNLLKDMKKEYMDIHTLASKAGNTMSQEMRNRSNFLASNIITGQKTAHMGAAMNLGGGPPGPPFGAGGAGGGPISPSDIVRSRFPNFAAGLATAGAAVKAGGSLVHQIGTVGERRVGHEADIAGMLGETAKLQEQRKGYELSYFGKERLAALDKASTRMKYSKMKDVTDLAGNAMMNIGGGAVGGAMVAGVPGAVIGGIGGLAKTAYSALGNDTSRSMVGSMLGIESQEELYDKIKSGEASKVYQQQLKLGKAKSFDKVRAAKYFEKERGTIQNLQRGFGMSDEDLFLGGESLYQRGAKAHFTDKTINQSMQAISRGGGTSRMVKEGAIGASQMARGLNLTNAGDILGKISGRTGEGYEKSKDELIRMYAEGTKIGFNSSDLPKEMRTFLGTAADMALKAGTSGQSMAGLLGSGIGTLSEAGIQASRTALGMTLSQTRQVGGLQGQYQIGALQSKKMNKLLETKDGKSQRFSMEETAMLAGMDVSRINVKDEYIQNILTKRGITDFGSDRAKAIIKEIRTGKMEATTSLGDKKVAALKELAEFKDLPKEEQTEKERIRLESRVRELTSSEQGDKYNELSSIAQKSKAGQESSVYRDDVDGKPFDFKGEMEKKTGKGTDKYERQASVGVLDSLENLDKKSVELYGSFDTTKLSTIKLGTAMSKLASAMDAKSKELFKTASKELKQTLQNQAVDSDLEKIMSENPDIFGAEVGQ